MKKLFIILPLALIIISCGPSQKDKDTAAAACSEIVSTRNFESARRVAVYNKARMDLGMKPISSSSDETVFDISIKYGGFDGCMDLFFPPPPPPPPTQAELEAQEEVRIATEEKRKKAEEEKRIIAEEEVRKASEREKWIADNIKTTHLFCTSRSDETIWEEQADGKFGHTILGPEYIALIELNKVGGEKAQLEKYGISGFTKSPLYFDIAMHRELNEDSMCVFSPFIKKVGEKRFCIGEYFDHQYNYDYSGIPSEGLYDDEFSYDAKESPSYGNPIISWNGNDFFLDRVNLKASTSIYNFGHEYEGFASSNYQCEVVSRDFHDQKLQSVKDHLQSAIDAENTKLETKNSNIPQI